MNALSQQLENWCGCGRRWYEGLEEEVVVVTGAGKDGSVWKMIARSFFCTGGGAVCADFAQVTLVD